MRQAIKNLGHWHKKSLFVFCCGCCFIKVNLRQQVGEASSLQVWVYIVLCLRSIDALSASQQWWCCCLLVILFSLQVPPSLNTSALGRAYVLQSCFFSPSKHSWEELRRYLPSYFHSSKARVYRASRPSTILTFVPCFVLLYVLSSFLTLAFALTIALGFLYSRIYLLLGSVAL